MYCDYAKQRALTRMALSLAVTLGGCGALRSVEQPLVFYPARYPEGNWHPADLEFEDAWFNSADGTRLSGWFVPCEHPRAVVLLAHGNAGNVTHRADLLRGLHRLHAAVLCFDYRGYGRSVGKPDEPGVLADARAARAWLAARAGIPESQIVLMGESLGGGVAVDLAAKDGARGLILKSTFGSIRDMAAADFPFSPVRPLVQIRFESAEKIPNYHGPLLQFHGDNDHVIPLSSARRLFTAANEPKRLVIIRGGDHNDPPPAEFYRAIDEFLVALK